MASLRTAAPRDPGQGERPDSRGFALRQVAGGDALIGTVLLPGLPVVDDLFAGGACRAGGGGQNQGQEGQNSQGAVHDPLLRVQVPTNRPLHGRAEINLRSVPPERPERRHRPAAIGLKSLNLLGRKKRLTEC